MKTRPDLHDALVALGFRVSRAFEWLDRRYVHYRHADHSKFFLLTWAVLGNGSEHWTGDYTDEYFYRAASDAIDRKGAAPKVEEWRREIAARVRAAESLTGTPGGQTSIL